MQGRGLKDSTGWRRFLRRGAMKDCEEVFGELEDPRTGDAKRHVLHEVL